jgi:hypothetical protein
MYHSFWKWQPRYLLTETRKLKRRQDKRYKNRSPDNNKWIGRAQFQSGQKYCPRDESP